MRILSRFEDSVNYSCFEGTDLLEQIRKERKNDIPESSNGNYLLIHRVRTECNNIRALFFLSLENVEEQEKHL